MPNAILILYLHKIEAGALRYAHPGLPMETGMKKIKAILRNRAGATAIEYGLIAALISVAAIAAMQGIGKQLKTTFNSTSSIMANK
jgi:pilus assembly protein Flp/PilA